MKCWALWFGGSNYSNPTIPEDVEEFDSIHDVKEEFRDRAANWDGNHPCVEMLLTEFHVFFSDPRIETPDGPDRIIHFGRRGGVQVRKC